MIPAPPASTCRPRIASGVFKPYYRFEGLDGGAGDPYYPSRRPSTAHAGLRVDPWAAAAVKLELSHDLPDPGPSFSAAALQVAVTF